MRATPTYGLIAILLAAGGCSLGRSTTPLQQYVLGGATSDVAVASPAESGLVIGVRRLDLAPYLATPAIVIRRGDEIVISQYHRWAEPPADGINRAVARYLAASGRIRAVDVAPWPVRARHDFLVQLHVNRFEGVVPAATSAVHGEAHVLASWEVIRQQDGATLARGTTELREPGWRVGDYAALVALLDRGLYQVARELETCLQGIGADSAMQCERS